MKKSLVLIDDKNSKIREVSKRLLNQSEMKWTTKEIKTKPNHTYIKDVIECHI